MTKTDVKAFLGLAGYYRKFVPQYASISAPLTELLKKGKPELVQWTAQCEEAFQTLKCKLSELPVLKVPDFSKPFVVQTDASVVEMGAVLSQTDENGHKHPIAFASQKLKPREQKYAIIEKECLAIIWALGFFYPYLYGQHFVIETDHQPLKCLQQMKNKNQRLTRWALSLQPLSDICHRAGAQHNNADGLSRGPPDWRF